MTLSLSPTSFKCEEGDSNQGYRFELYEMITANVNELNGLDTIIAYKSKEQREKTLRAFSEMRMKFQIQVVKGTISSERYKEEIKKLDHLENLYKISPQLSEVITNI